MGKLHEVLAVEKTVMGQSTQLYQDTLGKFQKPDFFNGAERTLKMIKDSPENTALELAARGRKEMQTTVYETLEYFLPFWAKAEDLQLQKNLANTQALAQIELDGAVIASDVPVDELMGLETRLDQLRGLFRQMPTLDAAREWRPDDALGRKGVHRMASPEVATKTEKIMYPIVMAPATDKHPAQVKEATRDEVVGNFTTIGWSGAATAVQKSEVLDLLDKLIAAVKQARQRANMVEVPKVSIGPVITNLIMDRLK